MTSSCCPICGRELPESVDKTAVMYPFCSRRCRMVDLGGWLEELYVVPTPLPASQDPSEYSQKS